MSRNFVGQATLIESNAAGQGGVVGEQVGGMMPGILESLQESGAAIDSSSLYYEEALGQFNAPSFQRNYGIKNKRVDNIEKFGDRGTFTIDNDIFWNGPAAISIKIRLFPRWRGYTQGNNFSVTPHFMYPSFFYSWGAGYAATKELRFNMGGAGQYTLDRYANFVGVFASCFSVMQRYSLMKLSGGGVINDHTGQDTSFGFAYNTATYGSVENKWFDGVASDGVDTRTLIPLRVRVPYEDNWIVSYKTPHTNYQNPRIRRRPLDTKLFSESFTVDLQTANFDEMCDSGTNVPPLQLQTDAQGGGVAVTGYAGKFPIIAGNRGLGFGDIVVDSENFRQYQLNYTPGAANNLGPYNAATKVTLARLNGTDNTTFNQVSNCGGLVRFLPNTDATKAAIGEPLTSNTLPTLTIETLISSMRLTNDMLGAYDVLKTRTDQAVYYPFQHFTTQIYYTQNTLYGNATLKDYINQTVAMFPESDNNLTPIRQAIAIPVNPMTAMYVGVLREKDRVGLGVSTLGGYSPCLFWNFLELPFLELTYGSEPLLRYESTTSYISEQTYEHCSPLQIPYKGGICLKSERVGASNINSNGVAFSLAANAGAYQSTNTAGLYTGVLRNAWVYELSLVEMEPLRNEAFFQQTPSFQGEQLNLSFRINPSTLSANTTHYSPTSDRSYLSSYYGISPNLTQPTLDPGVVEHVALILPETDNNQATQVDAATVALGIDPSLKGGPSSTRKVDVWHMNNDANLMLVVIYAQNALWQLNPNMSKMVFARG